MLTVTAGQIVRQELRVAQYIEGGTSALMTSYPGALSSLLEHVSKVANVKIAPEPVVIGDFADGALFNYPFVYMNAVDCRDWSFSDAAVANLRKYLENGGFMFVDAGITASFLRDEPDSAASHSYGEWEPSPEVKKLFERVLPENAFAPISRNDGIFRVFQKGLPDTSVLPDSVREYVEKEKWPGGTYSAVAIRIKGRIAVLCTPIIAMGWGRNSMGQWITNIQFRVLEHTEGLEGTLQNAAYSGRRFEVTREDMAKDAVFCQKGALPAWCREPSGRWRVFRYYAGREISDYTHVFYTGLATNFILYALLQ